MPGNDVRIEEIPVRARHDEGAGAPPGGDQALGGEHLQGLADRLPAHSELLGKLGLARQKFALGNRAGDDPAADLMSDLSMQGDRGVEPLLDQMKPITLAGKGIVFQLNSDPAAGLHPRNSGVGEAAPRMRRRVVRAEHLLIEVDDRTGHHAGLVAGEIGDGARDLGRLEQAPEGLVLLGALQPLGIVVW